MVEPKSLNSGVVEQDTQVSLQSFPITDDVVGGASKFVRNEMGQKVASHHFGGIVLSKMIE